MKKPKKLPHIDSWVIVKLRRASLMWVGRTKALQAARVKRGLYKCAMCEGHFRKGEYHLDHIDSVVPIDGGNRRKDDPSRVDFNLYIDRLFVPPEKYQVLCINCHDAKSALENSMRDFYKKERKKGKNK
jgi:galactose-1-phosphate uridylyltransferase